MSDRRTGREQERTPGRLVVHRTLGVLTLVLPILVALLVFVHPGLVYLILWIGVATFAACFVWLTVSHHRLRASVQAASGLACLNCGYDLSASGDSAHGAAGKCPECGTPFEAGQTTHVWRRWGLWQSERDDH